MAQLRRSIDHTQMPAQRCRIDFVNACENFAALARERRANYVEFRIAQDLSGEGLTLQAINDVTVADAVLRLQHIPHAWRRGTLLTGRLDHQRFGFERDGVAAFGCARSAAG